MFRVLIGLGFCVKKRVCGGSLFLFFLENGVWEFLRGFLDFEFFKFFMLRVI